MKQSLILTWTLLVPVAVAWAQDERPLSDATSECLDCHASLHPGIVEQWRRSRHAQVTPAEAMAVEGRARKVSSTNVPPRLTGVVVGCAECHGLRPASHADTFDHADQAVHVVVSPEDCAVCHREEARQYGSNLMSHAYANLADNPVYQALETSILGDLEHAGGALKPSPANDATRAEACYYCHGTKLKLKEFEVRDTELVGEMTFPVIEGWPNQGVGRINLDGSRGSCAACHARHRFSIETARKPHTCRECHVGPDVPAYKVYASSKHGNLYSSQHHRWDFSQVPWVVGRDFEAPTCAACHVSLLENTDGDLLVERSHAMSDRLPWRLFGLVYAHPHPREPDTTKIRNQDGLPLPTDFGGGLAEAFLIDADEQKQRTATMQKVCLACHDTSWVHGSWARLENTIRETNAKTKTGVAIMADIWQEGLAQGLADGGSPFDEAIERRWSRTWLFHANTIRFASAMGGGGDYGVFAEGRYQLAHTLYELSDWLRLHRSLKQHATE